MKRLIPLLLLIAGAAHAVDHSIPTGTSTVDCDTFDGGVDPGDTLTFATGTRGDITFNDCVGTSGNEITIRNHASEQTVIECDSTFCFVLQDSRYVIVDGTGKWSGAPAGGCGTEFVDISEFASDPASATSGQVCGIKLECTSGGSQQMMRFQGGASTLTKFVTIQGVEIDGGHPTCRSTTPGTGLTAHDGGVTVTTHTGQVWEGSKLLRSFIHDTSSECVYWGQNIKSGETRKLQQRDHEIAYNVAMECGYEAMNFKSFYADGATGDNSKFHHNYIANTGTFDGGGGNGGHGIAMLEGAYIDVYNNWVQDTSPAGNQSGACYTLILQNITSSDEANMTPNWWNNVAVDCAGHGFNINRGDGVGYPTLTAAHFNNTSVGSGNNGFNYNEGMTSGGTAQDNISCGSASSDLDLDGSHTVNNNDTGACSGIGFVSVAGRNFNLDSGSGAIDGGGNYASPPSDDFAGSARPQGLDYDQGAYEFVEDPPDPGGSITSPKPQPHTIDAGETLYPEYLYVNNEGSGTTIEDDGSATDCDMTITGADWSSDSLGRYLAFIEANSDFAANTSCTALAGSSVTRTMCAAARVAAPTGLPAEIIGGLTDASDANQHIAILTDQADGDGAVGIIESGGSTPATNHSPPFLVADDELHLICVKASDSSISVSVDGSAFDALAHSRTGLYTGIDTIAQGSRRRTTPDGYADADIYAFWVYTSGLTDANMTTMYNSGNPWPIIGVDQSGGEPPPVTQRGDVQDEYASGVTQ